MLVRALLVLLLVAWTLGAPGLGIETRAGGDLMGWVYTVTYLADILALVLTWRGRRFAPAVAAGVGAVAAIVATLDVSGVLIGPPPVGLIVLDLAAIAIGLLLIASGRRMRLAAA